MTGYLAGFTGPVVATTVTVVAAYSAPVPASAAATANLTTPAAPESDSPTTVPAPDPVIDNCPALGARGAGQSSPGAAPATDAEVLSMAFMPLPARAAEPSLVERAHTSIETATVVVAEDIEGAAPPGFVADRFAATARDLAEHAGAAGAPAPAQADLDGGSTGCAPGASATPNPGGAGQFPFGTGADGASSGGVTSIPPTVRPGEAARHYPFSTN